MGNPHLDLTGQRFGRLVVLRHAGILDGLHIWHTQCDCGNSKIAKGNLLSRGSVKSCGCWRRDAPRVLKTTHGKASGAHSRIYRRWNAMKQRCHNPNQPHYARYGGRGIQVCDRWRESFAAFYADMGDPPTEAHTLERIDNDGHYEPSNVRWATRSEQSRNQRPRRPYKRANGSHRGEAHHNAKFTEADVRAIRASSASSAELGRQYGAARQVIGNIRRRLTWRHVE